MFLFSFLYLLENILFQNREINKKSGALLYQARIIYFFDIK